MKHALICGSFDPVTYGHIDIIKRAAKIFDRLTVGVFINPEKEYLFSVNERLSLLSQCIAGVKNAESVFSDGLVADYVRKNKIDVIVKGVRDTKDFGYEMEMARINKEIFAEIETMFLIGDEIFSKVSSSLAKDKAKKGEKIDEIVPLCVEMALKEKYKSLM